ncbi:MAG: sigma 54-interacting transcriptional regulator [Bryobacteraceae bacterium]|nr:sigma 54-interacting transcriptional regulator [Bryobacteraceae bacterium]
MAAEAAQKLAAVLRICQRINSERNLTTLLDLVVEEATRLMDCERGSIFLLDRDRRELTSKVALGSDEVLRLDATKGIAGAVAMTGETINVRDAYADPRFYHEMDHLTGYRTRTLLAVPLRNHEGDIIGTFELLNKREGAFDSEDEELTRSLAANAAIAIQTAQLVGELRMHRRQLQEENTQLRREVENRYASPPILGSSERIQTVLRLIERIRDSNVGVLITGESGTGKDLVARAIHYSSPRARGPLIALNSAALPETLVETELFGVEKGVATGVEKRIGKFEAAHGGTLFLDEIGDLSLTAQAKILRVLQERVVERLGGRQTIPVDVRVIAATNKDLEDEIRHGRFREDLYYRLNVIHIRTPSLREIPQDIGTLANFFLQEAAREMGREGLQFSPEVVARMKAYHWPGNVRQLQNEVRRLAVCARARLIEADDLLDGPMWDRSPKAAAVATLPQQPAASASSGDSLAGEIADLERRRILAALEANNNNQVRTALALGLSRQGLINKLRRYGISTRRP